MKRLIAIAAALTAVVGTPAYADTVGLHSGADDPRALNGDYTTANATIAGTIRDLSLSVSVTPTGGSPITIGYNPGTPLALGTHEADGAELEVAGAAGTCDNPTASVTLKAVVDTVAGAAQILRMSFDQTCQGATTALHGTIDIEHPVGEQKVPGAATAGSVVGEGHVYAYGLYNSVSNHFGALHLVDEMVDRVIAPKGTADGLDAGRLAYQLVSTDEQSSDIHLLDTQSMTDIPLPGVNTLYWEWEPDVSGNHLIFQRDNGSGRRWAVYLYDLSTHRLRKLVTGSAKKSAIGTAVSGNYVVWEACKTWHCNIVRYRISTGHKDILRAPRTRLYYAPAITPDGTVYAVGSGNGCGVHAFLFRWRPGSKLVVLHRFSRHNDAGGTDVDSYAGTTYLYYGHVTCGAHQLWSGVRLPVSVPK
jgi:hypothetical protein